METDSRPRPDVNELPLRNLPLRSACAVANRCAERLLPLYPFATGLLELRQGISLVWDMAAGRVTDHQELLHQAGNFGVHVQAIVEFFAKSVGFGGDDGPLPEDRVLWLAKMFNLDPALLRGDRTLLLTDLLGVDESELSVRKFDVATYLNRHPFDPRDSHSGWLSAKIASEVVSKALYPAAYALEASALPDDSQSNITTRAMPYVRVREALEISVLVGGEAAYHAAEADIQWFLENAGGEWGEPGKQLDRAAAPPLWPVRRPPNLPSVEVRAQALKTYYDVRLLSCGKPESFTANMVDQSLELTVAFEANLVMFLASQLDRKSKTQVWALRFHVVAVEEFDVKVIVIQGLPHIFITEGAVKFFDFLALKTTVEDLVKAIGSDEAFLKRSVFGSAMFNPGRAGLLIPKNSLLSKAFDRTANDSGRDFVKSLAAELEGKTDLSLAFANTLMSCVSGSILADFLRSGGPLPGLGVVGEQFPMLALLRKVLFQHLVAFAIVHEYGHILNAPTDSEIAKLIGLPVRTWAELAADAAGLSVLRYENWGKFARAANLYFGCLQHIGSEYPDPLIRSRLLTKLVDHFGTKPIEHSTAAVREYLAELTRAGEILTGVGAEVGVGGYLAQFGVEDTMFGVQADRSDKNEMFEAALGWVLDELKRWYSGSCRMSADDHVLSAPTSRPGFAVRCVQALQGLAKRLKCLFLGKANANQSPRQLVGEADRSTPSYSIPNCAFEDRFRRQFEEGFRFFKGNEVEVDHAKAYDLLLPLANAGFAPAQNLVGDILWSFKNNGQVAADDEAAERWYRQAAAAGLSYSQDSLAAMLIMKIPDTVLKTDILDLLQKAADQGDGGAAKLLKICRGRFNE